MIESQSTRLSVRREIVSWPHHIYQPTGKPKCSISMNLTHRGLIMQTSRLWWCFIRPQSTQLHWYYSRLQRKSVTLPKMSLQKSLASSLLVSMVVICCRAQLNILNLYIESAFVCEFKLPARECARRRWKNKTLRCLNEHWSWFFCGKF